MLTPSSLSFPRLAIPSLLTHPTSHSKPTLPASRSITPTIIYQSPSAKPLNDPQRPHLGSRKRPQDPFLTLLDHPLPFNHLSKSHGSSIKRYRLSDAPCTSTHQLANQGSSVDPLATVLERAQQTGKVFSSQQVMSQAMRQMLINPSFSQPIHTHHPSTSKSAQLPTSHSLPVSSSQSAGLASKALSWPENLVTTWCEIYLEYLRSSSGPDQFARRLRDLINKRLPRRLSDYIISSHGLDPSLSHLVSTASYNELIGFYYRSNKYNLARRLLGEMDERGFDKHLETHELILRSYQALNKHRGVELTIEVIERLGLQITPHCWTSLFSIRPRRPETLCHHDSMGQSPPPPGSHNPLTPEPQRMSINKFLDGWRWGPARLHGNGWVLVNLSKRLMATGKWDLASKLVSLALSLDAVKRSAVTSGPLSRLAISPYWATSLLNALVFGLYNSKQTFNQASKAPRSHPTQPGSIQATQARPRTSAKSPERQEPLSPGAPQPPGQRPLPAFAKIVCVFEFVDSFLKKHPHHHIQPSTSLFLNCLRIQTCLAPSDVQTLLNKWTREHGLSQEGMGSRLGIRLAHVMAVWITSVMHEVGVGAGENSLEANKPGCPTRPPGSLPEMRARLARLLTEHRTLLDLWRGQGSQPGISRMILRGPVDGKLIRGPSSFYSAQCFGSIKVATKRLSKLHKKLVELQAQQDPDRDLVGDWEDPFTRFLEKVRRISNQENGRDGRISDGWESGLIIEDRVWKRSCSRIESKQEKEEEIRRLFRWFPERPDLVEIPFKAKFN